MKTYKVRLIACMLACMMICGAFAGCNGGKTTSSTGSGSAVSGTSDNSGVDEGKIDMKERTFVLAMSEKGPPAMVVQEYGAIYKSMRVTEEKYNCKFEIRLLPSGEGDTLIEQSHLSGVAEFDAFLVGGYKVVPQGAVSGNFLCMSDYYDFSSNPAWQDPTVKDAGVLGDKRFGLPFTSGSSIGIFYNKALLAAANQKDPWEYVHEGTWNWENFKALAKALTRGEQYGFASEEPYLQFVMVNGGEVIDMQPTGSTFKLGDEKSLKAINYIQSFYDEGIIPSPAQIDAGGMKNAFNAMATKKVAMFPYHQAYGPWLMDNGIAKEDVGWVYFPKGPDANDYVSPTIDPQQCLMILADVKNPKEAVLAFQDAFAYWAEGRKDGTTFAATKAAEAEEDMYLGWLEGDLMNMFIDLGSKNRCTNHINYSNDVKAAINTLLTDIRTKALTPAAAIETHKTAIEAAIKKAETLE